MDPAELESKFNTASGKFSMDFYRTMVEGREGNFIISPLAIQSALSLALSGAADETSTEIREFLKYDEPLGENIDQIFEIFMDDFKKCDGFKMATKLIVPNDYLIKPSFQESATSVFNADVENLNLAEKTEAVKDLNQSVAEKSENLIQDLIEPEDFDDSSSMVLANAICFQGSWVHPFNSTENFRGAFFLNENDEVEVEYMLQRNYFKYGIFYELKSIVVEIPYEHSHHASLLIILPESRNCNSIHELEEKLNEIDIIEISSKLEDTDVKIQLPKFRIELKEDLSEKLKEAGIGRAFDAEDAQFDGILESDDKLNISKVIHKCFFEVNEKGTESVESTERGFEFMSMPSSYIPFCQPFVFALKTKNNVIFMGRCCEPKM